MPALFAPILFFFSLCGGIEPHERFGTRDECNEYVAEEIVAFKKKYPKAIAVGYCVRSKW